VAAGLIYRQVKKRYRRRQLVGVTYVLRCATREAVGSALRGLGLSGKLNTAFVERVNLTVRQSVAALIRRTWSTLQEASQLLMHLEWWRAYEHFVRRMSRCGCGSSSREHVAANVKGSGSGSGEWRWRPGSPIAALRCAPCWRCRWHQHRLGLAEARAAG